MLSTLVVVCGIGIGHKNAVIGQADVHGVMLDDVGSGFELTDESVDPSGALTRTFTGPAGSVQITGFAVTTPPGTRQLFEATPQVDTFDLVDEPSLDLARWAVPAGQRLGDSAFSALTFASRDHFFTIILVLVDGATIDGPAFVLELAGRQIEIAGEPLAAVDLEESNPADLELASLMPEAPPQGYGLDAGSITLPGSTLVDDDELGDPEVVDFLNKRAAGFAQAWGRSDLTVAAGVTKYPYDIFAAHDLAAFGDLDRIAVPAGLPAVPPDAVVFRSADLDQIGVAFRRGDILVLVLTTWVDPATQLTATSLAVDTAALVAPRLPDGGGTSPYVFPTPPSRLVGLASTAGFVVLAVAGARMVARLRARRVRRMWADDPEPAIWPPPRRGAVVVPLDADAALLRRRGAVVMMVQLVTITIGVVALSGDFAWAGVIVAACSLVVGLLFTRWWLQKEHRLLGPSAPPRAFRVPRPAGAIMGIVAFAVLGVGVAYLLKGVRYTIFKPTLAQLRWADLLGMAPRTVGYVFAAGGLLVTMLGAVLWRIARSLGRARVREVLRSDSRPPVLYLRSFGDDAVPLPIIASARRPLFELFSIRGADPFEECVAWELDSYGPVVSVGRPGGSLASLGAAREHLSNETWHGEISDRMRNAGSIALAPGETAGLAWELEEIVTGGHLRKTIFVFPPLAPSELARRWAHTSSILRSAGAIVGDLPAPHGIVHTVQIGPDDTVRATCADTRDEATYRVSVDRALETAGVMPSNIAVPDRSETSRDVSDPA